MKKPNLREQFEKENPIPAKLTNMPNERLYSPSYVEWLETINSEMIDALVGAFDELEALKDNGWPVEVDIIDECKQALKKAGVE